jgi:hypothetical protein
MEIQSEQEVASAYDDGKPVTVALRTIHTFVHKWESQFAKTVRASTLTDMNPKM